ncbi:interleukin-2 receptor subunit beta-like [Eublepharis macularius]|uniref:Interleukin-2 receptor subunit beta-like n=1 Tax=Eublepharis macularius TaxID=481883 RepID=A0AA97L9T1_EUBMA|nr:interleukin-2 receptor subunit beta-like [Eublepharis macularius]
MAGCSPWLIALELHLTAISFQATWRMEKQNLRTAYLLQMLFLPPFLAIEQLQTGISSSVQCRNNYGFQNRRMDCTWHRNQTIGEGPFHLRFSDSYQRLDDLICHLSPSREAWGEFSCSAEGLGNFEENDKYSVYLHDTPLGKDVIYTVWENYEPMRNIKCDPPVDLQSNMNAHKCQIVWKKPKAYRAIWKALQWQLEFRANSIAWERAERRTVVTRETWMEIDGSEFKPGISYAARMRCKTPDNNDAYISQWSEWSATTEWNVPPGALQPADSLVLPAVFVSVSLGLGVLLFLLLVSIFYSRIKSHCLATTPNPVAFFLPLYTSHNGNFQDWIGTRERDVYLKSSNANSPSKEDGPRMVTYRPLEALAHISSFNHLSRAELSSEERACHLPGAPDQQDKASQYVVIHEAQKLPGEADTLLLSGRVPLYLEGLNATGDGFSYLPYKNSLFVEQDPQASCSLGTSNNEQGSHLCAAHVVGPQREARHGGDRLITAGKTPCIIIS